jgi:hypothetical protein
VSGINQKAFKYLLYSSAIYFKLLEGPRPFKQQKTFLSGLTTLRGALLDQGTKSSESDRILIEKFSIR